MNTARSRKQQPSLYITHGGGPCFFMDWSPIGPKDSWDRLGSWLRDLGPLLDGTGRPKAIVVVSAHWEDRVFAISGNARPPLLFDYYGFPEHTYRLTYPAPGLPELAQQLHELLTGAGLPARIDPERGFDHATFIPFKLIYPDAGIPIVQLSLQGDLDPARHLQAGRALAPLREQGVLIVGSGSSYHNLRHFNASGAAASETFDRWLTATACDEDGARRDQALCEWRNAPGGQQAHPREEHLLPLMVAAGAAGSDRGSQLFTDHIMGLRMSCFGFGMPNG